MALLHAVKTSNYDAVVAALKASSKGVNAVHGSYGWTPLVFAIDNSNVKIAEVLLKSGADVNVKIWGGNTPFHWAVCRGVDFIPLLLAHAHGTTNVDTKNNCGQTPLHNAAAWGSVSMVKMLVTCGADVESCCARGMTPLCVAIDRADVAQVLIEAGATVSPVMLAHARRTNMDFVVAAAARWGFSSLRSAWVTLCVCQKYSTIF